MPLSDLTIVIPAYNEEETLPGVLEQLSPFITETGAKLIIVNDGSKDQTQEVLEKHKNQNLSILTHKLNKGYGAALKSGLAEVNTKYAITIDSDGQHHLEDVKKLFNTLTQTNADMIVGSRKGLKNASLFRAIGKWLIRTLANILMDVPVYDINSGMKIYHTETMKQYLHLCPNTMAFSDIITLVFISNRHLVLEEPISIKERAGGESTIGIQAAYHTIMEIINIVILFHPMKIFMPVSLTTFSFGFVWTISFLITSKQMTTGGSFFMMCGIFIFLLGLITEQLSQIRKNSRL